MNIKEKDYILEYYGEFYNEECGKWNTSLKSKWYDYKYVKDEDELLVYRGYKGLVNKMKEVL